MAAGADGSRALIVVSEAVDVVPPSSNLILAVGTVIDESRTRPEGPHSIVDVSIP